MNEQKNKKKKLQMLLKADQVEIRSGNQPGTFDLLMTSKQFNGSTFTNVCTMSVDDLIGLRDVMDDMLADVLEETMMPGA